MSKTTPEQNKALVIKGSSGSVQPIIWRGPVKA
jgi:hypothetical protein